MARREASARLRRGDRLRQFRRPEAVPLLRAVPPREGRPRGRDPAEALPEMRAEVDGAGRDDIRLEEDPSLRMGRVPDPPF